MNNTAAQQSKNAVFSIRGQSFHSAKPKLVTAEQLAADVAAWQAQGNTITVLPAPTYSLMPETPRKPLSGEDKYQRQVSKGKQVAKTVSLTKGTGSAVACPLGMLSVSNATKYLQMTHGWPHAVQYLRNLIRDCKGPDVSHLVMFRGKAFVFFTPASLDAFAKREGFAK